MDREPRIRGRATGARLLGQALLLLVAACAHEETQEQKEAQQQSAAANKQQPDLDKELEELRRNRNATGELINRLNETPNASNGQAAEN